MCLLSYSTSYVHKHIRDNLKKECTEWIRRGEDLQLETGDFVFAGNAKFGHSRLHTGAMRERLRGQVPKQLSDGWKYSSVGASFLLSRYEPGQYFAPYFDGRGSGVNTELECSEFTVVLYLTDDFVGAATHYLSGQGSQVKQSVVVRPHKGCASVHRQGTVLHAGGAVVEGTKYIMQFFLYYEAPEVPEPMPMTNLRWGVWLKSDSYIYLCFRRVCGICAETQAYLSYDNEGMKYHVWIMPTAWHSRFMHRRL